MGTRLLPQIILIILGVLSLVMLITGGTSVAKRPTAAEKAEPSESLFNSKKLVFTIILTLIYIVAINYLGFFVSTFCFLVIMYYYIYSTVIKKTNYLVILIPLIMLVFLFLVFRLWLRVPVPSGILF